MHAEWTQVSGTEWVFTIKADRFLRNMVRAVAVSYTHLEWIKMGYGLYEFYSLE